MQAAQAATQIANAQGLTDLEKMLLVAIGLGLLGIGGLVAWGIKTAFPQMLAALMAIPPAIKSFEASLETRDSRLTAKMDANTGALHTLTAEVAGLRGRIEDQRFADLEQEVAATRVEVARVSLPGAPPSAESDPPSRIKAPGVPVDRRTRP